MNQDRGHLLESPMPHSIEAEMSLLGSLLLDPGVFSDTAQIVTSPSDFYTEAHAAIYSAFVAVYGDSNSGGDIVGVLELLRSRGQIELVGGADYLSKLVESVPSAVNAPYYARLVSDKARFRAMAAACWSAMESLHEPGNRSVSDIIDTLQASLYPIALNPDRDDDATLTQLLEAELIRLHAEEDGTPGIATGYHDLDSMTGGLRPGEFFIIAARPSVGKTALGLNIARNMGERVPVGVFSLEMSREALAQRLIASESGVALHEIRDHKCGREQLGKINAVSTRLAKCSIAIDDTPSLTVMQLRLLARRMVDRHGIRALVVDYLQLLTAPGASRESRQVEVSAISRGIKALARELSIPVVCLAQLNRESESRANNRPRMSDLRESGSIEQDADAVMLLHREEYFHRDDREWMADPANANKIGTAELIVAKQRNGPTGTVDLVWCSETTSFKSKASMGGW